MADSTQDKPTTDGKSVGISRTPTPWNLSGNSAWWDGAKDRGAVFECRIRTGTHVPAGQNEANAAFIVRACNAHDDLLAALRSAERWLSEMHSETVEGEATEMRDVHSAAWEVIDGYRAAIAKAGGA
jgi:hypothetical protein